MGQTEPMVQPAIKDPWVRWPVLFFGRESEKGKECCPKGSYRGNSEAKGRTLVLLQLRHTQCAQPPQIHILPDTA